MGLALYQEVFQTEGDFNQAFCGLQFDNAVLGLALPQADAQLAALARAAAGGVVPAPWAGMKVAIINIATQVNNIRAKAGFAV